MPFSTPTELGDAYAGGALRVRMPAPRIDLDPNGPKVSVVIPAMNEARNLPWVAERMPAGIFEVILVDGSSVDDTVAVARSLWPQVRIIAQNRRGKGNALACGFQACRGEIVVMIDADGSMDPGEIPYFVAALEAGADYAKGSRFAEGGGSSDITRVRTAGNQALNIMTKIVHKTGYTDLCYGYNAFWTHVLRSFDLDAGSPSDDSTEVQWGDGFEVETLINIRAHLAGLAITEVASFETPRLSGTSNLSAVSDGVRVLRTIARESEPLRRGVHWQRRMVRSIVRPRQVAASLVIAAPAIAAHTVVERQHDLERGIDVDLALDDAIGRRRNGVRPMAARDLEVVDLAAYEREVANDEAEDYRAASSDY